MRINIISAKQAESTEQNSPVGAEADAAAWVNAPTAQIN
jgi:hypothetical protein